MPILEIIFPICCTVINLYFLQIKVAKKKKSIFSWISQRWKCIQGQYAPMFFTLAPEPGTFTFSIYAFDWLTLAWLFTMDLAFTSPYPNINYIITHCLQEI